MFKNYTEEDIENVGDVFNMLDEFEHRHMKDIIDKYSPHYAQNVLIVAMKIYLRTYSSRSNDYETTPFIEAVEEAHSI